MESLQADVVIMADKKWEYARRSCHNGSEKTCTLEDYDVERDSVRIIEIIHNGVEEKRI